ncbi:hypothetical protein FB566_2252 [Stackebrandtia endophytica]|uniref:Uncharacterized protein n=1 Tax=Stackebrandtia endophytica TaxID=1496996 RepID=A0A543AVW5_9ACTN|nr:hypothetical protein [Stackebrandtia endophytica]TQL76717.1 hypothetical protein FB566_2252 [Stackebrandtia endophytica]
MMKQVVRTALLVPALAAVLLIGGSQATAAATVDQSVPAVDAVPEKCGAFLGDGIRVRQAPRLNAPVNGYGYRGDCVLYNESTRGDQANCDGRSTNVWPRRSQPYRP